jgi:hypothetical protein
MFVWKYTINRPKETILMPPSAKPLHFGAQKGVWTLWALCEEASDLSLREMRYFEIYGTGEELPAAADLRYIGTNVSEFDGFVWHLFERLRA